MTFLKRAEKVGRKFLNPVPTGVGGFKMMWKVLPQYLMNREETEPEKALGPFRTDVSSYGIGTASGQRVDGLWVTWMGHSTMIVEIDGVRVLVDPVWDERASPLSWMGPKRFFEAPLRLEEMPEIDVVVVSHDHYDHLGKMTVRRLSKMAAMAKARWVTSLGVGEVLRGFGVRAEQISELDWTESISVMRPGGAELLITALPARHFSGRSAWNRFETLWSSFVLKGAKHNVYFGADSGEWEGFEEIGAAYGPFDLTMLEIGAYNDLWKDIHMGPDGAARSFEALRDGAGRREVDGLFMPIHWGLFNLALHGWRWPMERMTRVAKERGLKLWSPEPGRPSEVKFGEELRSDWWR